jgi:hypothetical protein
MFCGVSSLCFLVDAQRACGAMSARRPLTLVEEDRRPVLLPNRSVDTRSSCQPGGAPPGWHDERVSTADVI